MVFNEELVKILGKKYLERNNEITEQEYELNNDKATNMLSIIRYCTALADRNDGKIEYIVTKKIDQPAEIQLRFVNDLIIGNDTNSLEEFAKILDICDGFNVSGTGLEDGSFLVSFFVDNLYVKK